MVWNFQWHWVAVNNSKSGLLPSFLFNCYLEACQSLGDLYCEFKPPSELPAWPWDSLCYKRLLERGLEGKGEVVALFGLCSGSRGRGTWVLSTSFPWCEAAAGPTATAAPPQVSPSSSAAPWKRDPNSAQRSHHQGWRFGGSERSAWAPDCPCGFQLFLLDSSLSASPTSQPSLLPERFADLRLQHLKQRQKPPEYCLSRSGNHIPSGTYYRSPLICISPPGFCCSVWTLKEGTTPICFVLTKWPDCLDNLPFGRVNSSKERHWIWLTSIVR